MQGTGMERISERLRLREWRADEAEGVHRWLGNPEVNRYLTWGTVSLKESAAHLAEIIKLQSAKPRLHYYFAVELLSQPDVTIGDAGFTWIEPRVAEIGYFLEPEYWGSGYASEAAQTVIDVACELGAHLVVATCDSRNESSFAVMSRCGMRRVASEVPGRLRCEWVPESAMC